ncbi:MAG TPA: hypothetical protein DHM90_03265 [Clostridiaceae bacterium]|nr:hypothetical protein [Clostridiaceae bacterium]
MLQTVESSKLYHCFVRFRIISDTRYYSQFYKDYLIHSVVYNKSGQLIDGRLGMRLSKGCVRVSLANAKYIFDTIPKGTRIFIS